MSIYESQAKQIVIDYFRTSAEVHDGSAFGTEYVCQKLNCRPDVVFTRPLHAVEIKTDKDNLRRASNQLAKFGALFPYVSVACASRHLASVRALAPKECGIFEITKAGVMKRHRRAKISKDFSSLQALTLLPLPQIKQMITIHRPDLSWDPTVNASTLVRKEVIISAVSNYIERRIEKKRNNISNGAYNERRIIQIKTNLDYANGEMHIDSLPFPKLSFGEVPSDIAEIYSQSSHASSPGGGSSPS